MAKHNRRYMNKLKEAKHASCWRNSQRKKTLNKKKGGHRKLGTFRSKQDGQNLEAQ